MPTVVINAETGLAEQTDEKDAQSKLATGTHEAPIVSPDGVLGSAPISNMADLLAQGFKQPTTQELDHLVKKAKYSTTGQAIKSGVEGALESATLGVSAPVETAFGISTPEDMLARREFQPGARLTGQLLEPVAEAVSGVGLLSLAGKAIGKQTAKFGAKLAAEKIAEGIVEAAPSALAKIGTAAGKSAIHGAITAAGDEVAKNAINDPQQTMESALFNVGIGGAIGGVLGGAPTAVKSLWNSTHGEKLKGSVGALFQRVNGGHAIEPELDDLIIKSGLTIDPAVKAGLSDSAVARERLATLRTSDSKAGSYIRGQVQNLHEQVADETAKVFGKTKDDLKNLANYDVYDEGNKARSLIEDTLGVEHKASEAAYAEVRDKFKTVPLDRAEKDSLAAYILDPKNVPVGSLVGGSEQSLLNKVVKSIPKTANLDDLRNLASSAMREAHALNMPYFEKTLRAAFGGAEDAILDSKVSALAPELMGKHSAAKAGYHALMNKIEALNDVLRVGSFHGPKSFFAKLADDNMGAETLVKKLTNKENAEGLALLQKNFPEVADNVRGMFTTKMLKRAQGAAEGGEGLSLKSVTDQVAGMSPQLRSFILTPEMAQKLGAMQEVVGKLPKKGFGDTISSGISKTISDHAFGGVAGAATWLMGGGALGGSAAKWLGDKAAKELPDHVRLTLLRAMERSGPVNAAAFQTVSDQYQHAYAGTRLIKSAVNALVSDAKMPERALISSAQYARQLDKQLTQLNERPQDVEHIGGDSGHYVEDNKVHLTGLTVNAQNYLNNLKPAPLDGGTLGRPAPPSKEKQARYESALAVAANPVSIFGKIKNGTVTQNDLQDAAAMFPSVYANIQTQVHEAVALNAAKLKNLPMKQKRALSMVIGEPLDISLTPGTTAAAQGAHHTSAVRAQQEQPQVNTTGLKDLGKNAATPSQRSALKRAGG
jgi:hypothetical protein